MFLIKMLLPLLWSDHLDHHQFIIIVCKKNDFSCMEGALKVVVSFILQMENDIAFEFGQCIGSFIPMQYKYFTIRTLYTTLSGRKCV